MPIAITKDDRTRRINIGGGEETLYVAKGIKPEVVEFVLAQEEKRAELNKRKAAAKRQGDTKTRKALMKEYQATGISTQEQASKLQYS